MSTNSTVQTSDVSIVRVALGIGGLVAIIVGILILVWPGRTAEVGAAIIAVYFIIAGLVYAGLGIFSKDKSGWSRVGHIALGVIFVAAGIIAFANLAAATALLALIIGVIVGVSWIIEGIVSLSMLKHSQSKIWTIIFAALSIIAGIVVLFAPVMGALALWWILGISLVVLGIIQVVRAISFGKTAS